MIDNRITDERRSIRNVGMDLMIIFVFMPASVVVLGMLFLFGLDFFGYFGTWQQTPIPDAKVPVSIMLKGHEPHTFQVRVTGHIDGMAKIAVDNQPLEWIQGNVDWEKRFDYYDTEIKLDYRPIDVQRGELTVDYVFIH